MSTTELDRTSIEQQDPAEEHEDQKKTKSRRPPNTAFRQQRLKAWQPILTPKTVLPLLFVVGIIFAPLGGVLLWASNEVEEVKIDYSECTRLASTTAAPIPSDKVESYFKKSNYTSSGQPAQWSSHPLNVTYDGVRQELFQCQLQFEVTNDIGPPVLMYYQLTEFYQNHRRYVRSFDQDQLNGKFRSNSSIDSSDCDPLKLVNGTAIYPCGLIANSLFNDSFSNPVQLNANRREYNMTNANIAWPSDRDLYNPSPYRNDQVVPPPNWKLRYPKGYTDDNPQPNLKDWQEFQVWMRTAGLPNFSKLALRNDNETMRAGRYQVNITSNFPVTEYGGTKSLLLSTRTVMGGKNPFLGIAYIVVGGICILLGALFTALHLIKPRKLGDHTYLTWNNLDQPSTATTTGRQM